MAQIDGDLAVLDSPLPYTVYNKLLTNWRGAAAPTGALPGLIWSDSDDERLYHITAAGSNQIAQGTIMPVADGVRLTEPGGADYMDLLLDGSDAFIKWSDGNLMLMTDEGANTATAIYVKGKGTGVGKIYVYDTDDDKHFGLTWRIDDEALLDASCLLHIKYAYAQDIKCWSGIAAGNPYFYIYGYKTAVGVKYLRSYVHTDGDAYINAEQDLLLTAVAGGSVGIPSNFLNLGSASVGVVDDAITATCSWMKVTAEGAAHDVLITINGGAEGDTLTLTNEGGTYNVMIDSSECTNVKVDGDYTLAPNELNNITLMKIGATWYEKACYAR